MSDRVFFTHDSFELLVYANGEVYNGKKLIYDPKKSKYLCVNVFVPVSNGSIMYTIEYSALLSYCFLSKDWFSRSEKKYPRLKAKFIPTKVKSSFKFEEFKPSSGARERGYYKRFGGYLKHLGKKRKKK
jgi:hypothetical protein